MLYAAGSVVQLRILDRLEAQWKIHLGVSGGSVAHHDDPDGPLAEAPPPPTDQGTKAMQLQAQGQSAV